MEFSTKIEAIVEHTEHRSTVLDAGYVGKVLNTDCTFRFLPQLASQGFQTCIGVDIVSKKETAILNEALKTRIRILNNKMSRKAEEKSLVKLILENGIDILEYLSKEGHQFDLIILSKLLHLEKREKSFEILKQSIKSLNLKGIVYVEVNHEQYKIYRCSQNDECFQMLDETFYGQKVSVFRKKNDPDKLTHRPFSEASLSSFLQELNVQVLQEVKYDSGGSFGVILQKIE